MRTSLRQLGLGLAALTLIALTLASAGSASHAGPVYLGDQNLSTSMTSIRAIANEPAFYATNEWGNGIAAISYAPVGIGVYGSHDAATGTAPGVLGETNSTDSEASGVLGRVNQPSFVSAAVRGINHHPVDGLPYGVAGSAVGPSNYIAFTSGVWGDSSSGTGVNGTSLTGNGVAGTSRDLYGVRGEGSAAGVDGRNSNATNVGQLATPSDGASGFAAVANGNGVVGTANNGSLAYGVLGVSTSGYAGKFSGNVDVDGTLTKDAGAFRIDHPLDPAHTYLQHSFVESPDMKNVYDGVVRTDARGFATVRLPRYFQALNRDFRYQLTIVGSRGWRARVVREIANNRFTIETDEPRVKVSWQVTGIRKDAYANANRIQVEVPKPAREQGRYRHPELYGRSAALAVDAEKLRQLRSVRVPKGLHPAATALRRRR
jgi:hypothetical protein